MPALLVIVKRTIFEQHAGDRAPGEVLEWSKYESKAPRLTLLTRGDPLYLVTVRPGGERLWLVAKYEATRRTRAGVEASRPNAVPITDITYLRNRLRFDNDKGLTSRAGLLGNSLQTPRVLTAADVALLEEALDTDGRWKEAGPLDGAMPALECAAANRITFRYPIGPTEQDYDLRYETARSTIADILNASRDADLNELCRHELDVWVGQVSVRGRYLDEMFITFSGAHSFPAQLLRQGATGSRPSHVDAGQDPVTDGGFPEVRVRDGTIEGTWTMTWTTLLALSRRYVSTHGLADRTNDPYKQLASGSPEPVHFRWHMRSDRMGREAPEMIAEQDLGARRIPKPSDRPAVIAFGKTFGPDALASLDKAGDAAEAVSSVLAGDGDLAALSLPCLRAWLFFATKEIDQEEVVDEGHLGEVLAEIDRRCGSNAVPNMASLMPSLVPAITRHWTMDAIDFARSFDAYKYWGSLERVSAQCDRVRQHWSSGRLEGSLLMLRTALFMMYRHAHHKASAQFTALAPEDEDELRFVADLLTAIKAKIENS